MLQRPIDSLGKAGNVSGRHPSGLRGLRRIAGLVGALLGLHLGFQPIREVTAARKVASHGERLWARKGFASHPKQALQRYLVLDGFQAAAEWRDEATFPVMAPGRPPRAVAHLGGVMARGGQRAGMLLEPRS